MARLAAAEFDSSNFERGRQKMDTKYDQLTGFHGHSCPGLAIGYRMAKAAMDFLLESSAKDEELVAIVENDACGVDAVQCLTGCTFGKGNLIFKDYGKQVYTFYSRNTRKGIRVAFKGDNIPDFARNSVQEFINWLLSADEKDVVELREVFVEEPEPAKIHRSVKCEICGESVMETRVMRIGERCACIPCAQKY